MLSRLSTVVIAVFVSVRAFSAPFFPLDATTAWTYSTPEGAEIASLAREADSDDVWKQELRRDDGQLLEASWFTDTEDGITLSRTTRFDPQATVTVDFSEPILLLPENFPKRRKWAGRAPNSTILVEMNLRSTPVRARVRMTYTYQCVVGASETIGQWDAIPVTETAVLEIASVEPETGSPQLDAMLKQLLVQPGFLPYQAGSVLKWSATRWFTRDVGEVKSEETAVAPNGKRETRVRTLKSVEMTRQP
jgi:hypothetical protein